MEGTQTKPKKAQIVCKNLSKNLSKSLSNSLIGVVNTVENPNQLIIHQVELNSKFFDPHENTEQQSMSRSMGRSTSRHLSRPSICYIDRENDNKNLSKTLRMKIYHKLMIVVALVLGILFIAGHLHSTFYRNLRVGLKFLVLKIVV